MFATKMNKKRVPAFIKKRGIPGGNPLRPKGDITGQTFGIDPFGPGMGAKKGKMIKARGGRLARVKPTKKNDVMAEIEKIKEDLEVETPGRRS